MLNLKFNFLPISQDVDLESKEYSSQKNALLDFLLDHHVIEIGQKLSIIDYDVRKFSWEIENLVASVFSGTNSNSDSDTIFYDIISGSEYISVKASSNPDIYKVLNSSKIKIQSLIGCYLDTIWGHFVNQPKLFSILSTIKRKQVDTLLEYICEQLSIKLETETSNKLSVCCVNIIEDPDHIIINILKTSPLGSQEILEFSKESILHNLDSKKFKKSGDLYINENLSDILFKNPINIRLKLSRDISSISHLLCKRTLASKIRSTTFNDSNYYSLIVADVFT